MFRKTSRSSLVGPCDNHVEIFSKVPSEVQRGSADFVLNFAKQKKIVFAIGNEPPVERKII